MSPDARARIVDAMVLTVHERGFAGTTVREVCARASVSRPTFYEAFDSREACFLAVIDGGYRQARELIIRAFAQTDCWREGVRGALVELLEFFDAEPLLARVWLVESLAAGSWALERREGYVADLIDLILRRWPPPPEIQTHELATIGAMTTILGMVQNHLLAARPEPLLSLLGPLMGAATAPYLDRGAVAEEIERSHSLAQGMLSRRNAAPRPPAGVSIEMPEGLLDPRAYRARQCLLYLSRSPGASNRGVASAIGVLSHTQISTLLARLARSGLVDKRAGRPGHPNAWWLTPYGTQITDVLASSENMLDGSTHVRVTST